MKTWIFILFLLSTVGITNSSHADTEIDGAAITSSFTMTGPVFITTLTVTNISISTVSSSKVQVSDGTTALPSITFSNDLDTGLTRSASNTLDVVTAGTLAARWLSAGEVTQPLQPSFLVTAPSNPTNVTGDGTLVDIEYDTEIYDQGNDFNTGAFTFTAPVSGRYFLQINVEVVGTTLAAGHTSCAAFIVTSNRNYRNTSYVTSFNTVNIQAVSAIADMDANDTAKGQILCQGGTKVVSVNDAPDRCFFSGSLIN